MFKLRSVESMTLGLGVKMSPNSKKKVFVVANGAFLRKMAMVTVLLALFDNRKLHI